MTQTPACPLYNDTGQSLPVVPPLLPAPAGGVRLPEVRLVHRGEVAVQPGRARGVDVARILRCGAHGSGMDNPNPRLTLTLTPVSYTHLTLPTKA